MGGEEMDESLRFTGNWFIDAGILGFVNLMEEVYGWDLKELQSRLREEPGKVYYGYFPLAYFYNLSTKSDNNREVVSEAIKEIEMFKGNKYELLEMVWWRYITQLFKEKWVRSKLEKMYVDEITDKNDNLKSAFKDDKYKEFILEREKLLSNVACSKEYQDKLKSLLKKSPCRDKKHNLNLNDLEKLQNAPLYNLPMECKEKIQEAVRVHRELKGYLESQWDSLQSIPDDESLTVKLKEKSRYFRIPVDVGFYKNFMFFNNSRGVFEQFEDLKSLIDGDTNYSEYLQKIDKTLSKFLPSDSEFPNVYYTKLRVKPLLEYTSRIFVYLLNFLNAFTFIPGVGNIFFYGGTLDFSYWVNKRLKILKGRVEETKSAFKLTWQAVIDTLVESKAKWSLENMYIIQFSGMNYQTQSLINVEYIGIPKLHASVILDDDIRDALNTSLPLRDSQVWLLGEFIKQKPLYPLIIKHVWNAIKGGYLNWRASFYALAVDAKLKQVGSEKEVFGRAFLERPSRAVTDIKEFSRDMGSVASQSRGFSSEISGKNLIHPLLSAIKRHNRNAFVNILLKALLQAKSQDRITSINNYIFRRILTNDFSWENFALAVVIGLVGGVENVSSREESEE